MAVVLAAVQVDAAGAGPGSSPAGVTARFSGLGDLAGGTFESHATGVSADGSVVVGYGVSAASVPTAFYSTHEAFRWTQAGGMAGLGDLPGGAFSSSAAGVSADGSVVVGSSESAAAGTESLLGQPLESFRWTPAGGMASLGVLPGGWQSNGRSYSGASAASADGSVVVGGAVIAWDNLLGTEAYLARNEAFRWTQAGGMVGLGDLQGGFTDSSAAAVSADGAVIVGSSDSAATTSPISWIPNAEAFRWTQADGMVGLGFLPGGAFKTSHASGVSADGQVVVGDSTSSAGVAAFRWTQADGMVGLGDLQGGFTNSSATAVSADGAIVVGSGTSASGSEAVIWDASHGMRSLSQVLVQDYGLALTGWTLVTARGVSADGRTIVGEGKNPSGQSEGWIAVLDLPDSDGDGVDDTSDDCPFAANANQADRGGVGAGSGPDGIGDACQCGDVNGDGRVTLADAVIAQRSLLQPPTATLTKPELCDVGGSAGCTLADAVVIGRALLAPPTAAIHQVCAPANP